jgi:nicotinate-nucleotide adenylyltransferase
MVRMAVEGNPFFEASSIEVERGGRSYTVDTLRTLKEKRPDAELFFITGTDAIVEISTWREPRQVLALSKFIVAARKGVELSSVTGAIPAELLDGPAAERVLLMESPLIDISASGMRERVSKGWTIRYLVPETVLRFIEDSGLYQKV